MFLEIAPHTGVYYSEVFNPEAVSPSEESIALLDRAWFQNLSVIERVIPGEIAVSVPDNQSEILRTGGRWSEFVGMRFLHFYPNIGTSGHLDTFTLVFSEEGIGEYNRIKRTIMGDKSFNSQD